MRLYVVRHGDPNYETGALTPRGHGEAKVLAQWFAKLGLTRIYSSPIPRAMETAHYTAKALGLPIEIENWTQEIGLRLDLEPWGNIHIADVPGEVVRGSSSYPTTEDWHSREPYTRTEGAQELARLKVASDEFIARQGYQRHGGVYRLAPGNRDRVVVFCHMAFGLAWLSHLLELPTSMMWSGFYLPPSSITTLLFEERSKDLAVPVCLGLGETPHLYASDMPIHYVGLWGNLE